MERIGWAYEALFDAEPTALEQRIWESMPSGIRVGSMGYRTKTTKAGRRLEVDIYPMWGRLDYTRANRALKQVTPETMRRVNESNARRRLIQLADANFDEHDLHLTLTYEHAPCYSRAQKDIGNFIKAVRRRRQKAGLPEMKYIYVIEDNEDGMKKRIHAHMLISGGIDRAELEKLWARGYANAYSLQPDERGLEGLARYMVKSQKNRRKWSCSKNLKKPQVRVSDCKLSNGKVKRMARSLPNEAREILSRAYPGYTFVDCRVKFSDQVDGVYIRALLRREDTGGRRKKCR